jgi:hypothetical protein
VAADFDFSTFIRRISTPGTFSFPSGQPSSTLSLYGNRKVTSLLPRRRAGLFGGERLARVVTGAAAISVIGFRHSDGRSAAPPSGWRHSELNGGRRRASSDLCREIPASG